MGVSYPSGQLVRAAARAPVSFVPRRTLTTTPIYRAQDDQKPGWLSGIKQWYTKKEKSLLKGTGSSAGGNGSQSLGKATHTPSAPQQDEGDLGASSIFADDIASGANIKRKKQQLQEQQAGQVENLPVEERNKDRMQMALNPNPKAQFRWEQKMVIREIRKRGRIPKAVQIKRTERETLEKSHWFKTSVKKLGPLARQIAGKNIDEAILQMRFSKKKAAKDVLEHLEHAKNVAMVRAGMGLPAEGETPKPVTITLKDGERKRITDPTSIYIEQAWVNRGPYGFGMDHRARGTINTLRPPATGLSVVLKEEKTRIRQWQDREADALRKRRSQLWTQLPDRKISAQNQYYSW
ncbi:Ribosomal protein L22/L17 [Penicillium sp. IBT 18751x]|nr:Ribosomal protein L22/L17 [Penicillium sp. IBT 18751x]